MALLRIDHVQLAMPAGGESEAEAFYSGLLGLTPVAKPAELSDRGGCWFEADQVRVHVGVEEDFRPARKAHPAFAVDDLHELLGRMARAGVPVRPAETLEGVERAHVDDPFGNRVELISGP